MNNRLKLTRNIFTRDMYYLSWEFDIFDDTCVALHEFDSIFDIRDDISLINPEWKLLKTAIRDCCNNDDYTIENLTIMANECKEIAKDYKTHLRILKESIDDKWNKNNANNINLLLQKYNEMLDKLDEKS